MSKKKRRIFSDDTSDRYYAGYLLDLINNGKVLDDQAYTAMTKKKIYNFGFEVDFKDKLDDETLTEITDLYYKARNQYRIAVSRLERGYDYLCMIDGILSELETK